MPELEEVRLRCHISNNAKHANLSFFHIHCCFSYSSVQYVAFYWWSTNPKLFLFSPLL